MFNRFLLATLIGFAAIGAAAQTAPAPLRVPPPPPKVEDLSSLTPYELARGYLAATAALPVADAAAQGLGVANMGIDGKEYRVDAGNAADFIPLLKARAQVYGKAITARGTPMLDGQYLLTAGPGCKGEKFDPRLLFAAVRGPDGTPLMATTAHLLQTGLDTNLMVTFNKGREVFGELLTGVTVENTIVFTKVMGNGFSMYGTIKGNSIELEFDPEEVKNSIGAEQGTDADWTALADCVFTLTKR